MPFSKSITERGPVYADNGATVYIPTDSKTFAPLIPMLEEFVTKATEAETVMRPEAMPAQVARIAGPLLGVARKALHSATESAREVEALKVRVLTPPPAIADAARAFGGEVRGNVRTLDPGAQAAFVQQASAVELAALLEQGGGLAGLNAQMLDLARERALSVFHVERTALNASHPNVPTTKRMIAVGTSRTDTAAAAEIAVANYKARVEAVEADESVLQHLIGFISASTATTPAQALAHVQAAA